MLTLLFALDLAAATPAPPAPPLGVPHICGGRGWLEGKDGPFDLDGDGVADVMEPMRDSCGTGGCGYTVYLAKAPTRAIGEIHSCWMTLAEEKHHGLFDIITVWRGGANSWPMTRYRFDGRRYRAVRPASTRQSRGAR